MTPLELIDIEGVSDRPAKRPQQHRRGANSIAILGDESHDRAELIERAATLEGASRAVDHQAAQKLQRFLRFRPAKA